MRRLCAPLFLSCLLLGSTTTLFAETPSADRPRQKQPVKSAARSLADEFSHKGLHVGDPLPDVTIYDADGNEFNLRRLKDHYSVIVFGCLT